MGFRISFPNPPEVHELVGVIVWAQDPLEGMGEKSRRYGIEWLGASREARGRLRQLAHRAVPPAEEAKGMLFPKAWLADDGP